MILLLNGLYEASYSTHYFHFLSIPARQQCIWRIESTQAGVRQNLTDNCRHVVFENVADENVLTDSLRYYFALISGPIYSLQVILSVSSVHYEGYCDRFGILMFLCSVVIFSKRRSFLLLYFRWQHSLDNKKS